MMRRHPRSRRAAVLRGLAIVLLGTHLCVLPAPGHTIAPPDDDHWHAVPRSWKDGHLVLETNLPEANWDLRPGDTVHWAVRAWLAPDTEPDEQATLDVALSRYGPQAAHPGSVMATIEVCTQGWRGDHCRGERRALVGPAPVTSDPIGSQVPDTLVTSTDSAWILTTLYMPTDVPTAVADLDGTFVLEVTATGSARAAPPGVPVGRPSLATTGDQLAQHAVAALVSIATGLLLARAGARRRVRT